MKLIFQLWPKHVKDYGDAVLTAASQSLGSQIATFDQFFLRSLKKLNMNAFQL